MVTKKVQKSVKINKGKNNKFFYGGFIMTEFEQQVEAYRQKREKNIAIAVMLYILSVVVLIGFWCRLGVIWVWVGFDLVESMLVFSGLWDVNLVQVGT